MSSVPIFVVDAFVGSLNGRELLGNPAAVVPLETARDAAWMQRVALEMNLSETAFVSRIGAEAEDFDLRWFTPTEEVDLCGHATLASARVLWEAGWLSASGVGAISTSEIARFHTRSGVLTARRRRDGIDLDFPAQEVAPRPLPAELRESVLPGETGVVAAFRAADDWVLEVETADLSRLQPDFAALKRFCALDNARGVIVTARGEKNGQIDFVSRFFGPAVGVDEDPVTGSAHTKLAPFWSKRLGKLEMLGLQDSARGGLVRVKCAENRVILGGQTRLVLRGELFI